MRDEHRKLNGGEGGGGGGNKVKRKRGGGGGGGGCPNRGMFAKNIIDSCTNTVEQKNIL